MKLQPIEIHDPKFWGLWPTPGISSMNQPYTVFLDSRRMVRQETYIAFVLHKGNWYVRERLSQMKPESMRSLR